MSWRALELDWPCIEAALLYRNDEVVLGDGLLDSRACHGAVHDGSSYPPVGRRCREREEDTATEALGCR